MSVIAVITSSERIFQDFKRMIHKDCNEDYIKISEVDNARGITFTGMVKLYDCYSLRNLSEIIYTVKVRTRHE